MKTPSKALIISLGRVDEPRIDSVAAGETAVFLAQSQLPFRIEKILIELSGVLVEVSTADGQNLKQVEGYNLGISEPLYITIRNAGNDSKAFFPAIVGSIFETKRSTILPMRRISSHKAVVIPVKSTVTLTKDSYGHFNPKRIVARSLSLESLVLEDVRIGKNSQTAASGQVSMTFFEKNVSPEIFLDRPSPGIPISAIVSNLSLEDVELEIDIEGESYDPEIDSRDVPTRPKHRETPLGSQ